MASKAEVGRKKKVAKTGLLMGAGVLIAAAIALVLSRL